MKNKLLRHMVIAAAICLLGFIAFKIGESMINIDAIYIDGVRVRGARAIFAKNKLGECLPLLAVMEGIGFEFTYTDGTEITSEDGTRNLYMRRNGEVYLCRFSFDKSSLSTLNNITISGENGREDIWLGAYNSREGEAFVAHEKIYIDGSAGTLLLNHFGYSFDCDYGRCIVYINSMDRDAD